MMMLQRDFNEYEGGKFIGFIIAYLAVILVFSLINTGVLRLVADIIVKRMPAFAGVFWGSFLSLTILAIGDLIIRSEQSSPNASIFNRHLIDDVSLIQFLPIVLFILINWFFNSKYLFDSEDKAIGFGKGALVTVLQFAFLIVIGLLISVIGFLYIWK
jgi:hypothetical protein